MKKIIFAALSVLMIFSLIGCGEHIDYTPNRAFSTGDIAGVMNGWPTGNASNWLSADDDKYEYVYEFTATKEMGTSVQFKVRSTAGQWDTGDFGGAKLDTKGTKAELTPADFGGTSAEFPVEASHKYKITVTSEDGKVYGKVEDLGLDIIPVPFIFNNMFVVGNDFGWTTEALANALVSYTKDLSGNVTYTKQFTAAEGDNHTFRICQSDWKAGFGGNITVAANGDAVELSSEVNDKGETPNVTITGLKSGNPYKIVITTTPDEKVSVKIEEIASVSFKFKIIGLTEGDEAWLNGSVWGSSWPCGWPLKDWGTPGNGLTLSDAAVADESGVAIFSDKWNYSTTVQPGSTLSYEVKFVASDDSWATTKYNNSNIKIDIDVESTATYLITVNAADNTATVTKE